VTALGGLALVAWGACKFGSYSAAMAYCQGRVLFTASNAQLLGEVPSGETKSVRFRLRNLKARPITVIGAETSCGCMVLDELPLTFGANEERQFSMRFKAVARDAGKPFDHSAKLFLDVPGTCMVLRVTGFVTAVEPPRGDERGTPGARE
jgi:hypothetical protein